MLFETQIDPDDKNCLKIAVRQKLVKKRTICLDGSDESELVREEIEAEAVAPEGLLSFYEAVTALDGIGPNMVFERYAIIIDKGDLYEWSELMPHLRSALETFVAVDKTLTQASSKKDALPKRMLRVERRADALSSE
jgi:hypothetical protein